MNIEKEIIKKCILDKDKLIPFGFIKDKDKDNYKYITNIMNNKFRVEIIINANNELIGKIYDIETNEEYTNFRVENLGAFSNSVKEEYINILKNIVSNCYISHYFSFNQTNRIVNEITKKYNVSPEFLWDKYPSYGIFRSKTSNKWFAAILNVDKSKVINNESGEIEIINVKVDDLVNDYLKEKGIFPAYHMSKKSWITIILNDTCKDEKIMDLIDISYELVNKKSTWIIPANPKVYDIISDFKKSDIMTWKHQSSMELGDIIYIYMTKPMGYIKYKCQIIDVNDNIMTIKLIKEFDDNLLTFDLLNNYGLKSVRSPRRIPDKLNSFLETIREV